MDFDGDFLEKETALVKKHICRMYDKSAPLFYLGLLYCPSFYIRRNFTICILIFPLQLGQSPHSLINYLISIGNNQINLIITTGDNYLINQSDCRYDTVR